MRPLTREEIELIAGGSWSESGIGGGGSGGGSGGSGGSGGNGGASTIVVTAPQPIGSTIVVTAHPPTSTSPTTYGDITFTSSVINPLPASVIPATFEQTKIDTPNHNHVTVNISLSDNQVKELAKIVDYGTSHGFNIKEIGIAVNQAFYESSLGNITKNPSNPDVVGLYQYDSSTWNENHSNLNRNNDTDQITAIYQDITKYESRYTAGVQGGQIPTNLDFADYFEIKHHLGNSSTDFTNSVIYDYNNTSTTLGLAINGAEPISI